jgi:hypothetical protein
VKIRLAILWLLPTNKRLVGKIDGDVDMCILAAFVVNAPEVWHNIHHST